jgi:capsular exopolysaccharide synthesis family protein
MLGKPEAPKVIAVTSALPREGKSTTSICLARTIANTGARTVLVDCDARRRSVSETLLPEDWRGLMGYLAGETSLDQALHPDSRTELQVLGFNTADGSGSDLFTEGKLTHLLNELSERFDVILMDTAPVLGIAETRAVAAAADVVLLLARWRSTSIKAADTAVEILLGSGAKLEGAALTIVDVRHYASTGQQDVYSYHRKFAGYYTN